MSNKSKYAAYFDISTPSKDKATCKKCGKVVSVTSRTTANMRYHVEKVHKEKFEDSETELMSPPGKKKRKTEESPSAIMNSFIIKKKLELEELVSREATKGVSFRYIASSDLIHDGIRRHNYEPPKHHSTVRNYVRKSAEKHRQIYRDKFQALLGKKKRFCIIADAWTCSTKKKDYLNVILHTKGKCYKLYNL